MTPIEARSLVKIVVKIEHWSCACLATLTKLLTSMLHAHSVLLCLVRAEIQILCSYTVTLAAHYYVVLQQAVDLVGGGVAAFSSNF